MEKTVVTPLKKIVVTSIQNLLPVLPLIPIDIAATVRERKE